MKNSPKDAPLSLAEALRGLSDAQLETLRNATRIGDGAAPMHVAIVCEQSLREAVKVGRSW